MNQHAGFGSAEQSNQRFRALLDAGQEPITRSNDWRIVSEETSAPASGSASEARYSYNASTKSALASSRVGAAVITPGSSAMRACTQPFSTVSYTAVQVRVDDTTSMIVPVGYNGLERA